MDSRLHIRSVISAVSCSLTMSDLAEGVRKGKQDLEW